jgi:hypothetical protein
MIPDLKAWIRWCRNLCRRKGLNTPGGFEISILILRWRLNRKAIFDRGVHVSAMLPYLSIQHSLAGTFCNQHAR